MFPEASEFFSPLVFALSVVAIIYTSLVALAQDDLKTYCLFICRPHGFCNDWYFHLNSRSEGAIFQMLSHIVSGLCFYA